MCLMEPVQSGFPIFSADGMDGSLPFWPKVLLDKYSNILVDKQILP